MGQETKDTTLTKMFVGGLAWETEKETLKAHFEQYGEIAEAVIISDKVTGRSKGYGFVTFKEAEAAKKACEEATPVINGRRANCNLASLGARRAKPSPPASSPALYPQQPVPPSGPAPAPARWYYPPGSAPPPPSPFYHGYPPFFSAAYGYAPSYMPSVSYNPKPSHSAGRGFSPQGQIPQAAYPGQGGMVAPNAMLPVYPMYQHQLQAMRVPASHISPPAAAADPNSTTKPNAMAPASVEQAATCS